MEQVFRMIAVAAEMTAMFLGALLLQVLAMIVWKNAVNQLVDFIKFIPKFVEFLRWYRQRRQSEKTVG